MRVWLHQHHIALRLALRRLAGAPVNTLLSLLAIGAALALPLGGMTVYADAQQLARSTSRLPQISVFLQLDAEPKAVDEIGSTISGNSGVASVRFLPREATLKNMRESEGMSAVIDALPSNPFPDAFVVMPADADAEKMEQLATQFRKLPKVEHVQIDSAWIRRLDALLRLARTALGILSLLLGIGLIAITFNTIRLQVLTLRNEITVSQLLGATDAFIGRPFFYFGTLQGMLGGGIAWLIVAASARAMHEPLTELATLYDLNIAVAPPGFVMTMILLAVSGGLGWVGTALSLSQYLRRSTMR